MESSKNAMYAQAGKSRGWSQANAGHVVLTAPPAAVPVMPVPEAVTVPIAQVVHESVQEIVQEAIVIEAPVINAPPHMAAPPAVSMPPMVEMPLANVRPAEACDTLVMAVVPRQKWRELYELEQGFHRGTLFAELDLPFIGEGACNRE